MPNDIESPSEASPLIQNTTNASSNTASPSTASIDSGSSGDPTSSGGSVTTEDEIKDELDKPWPATFERGIMILAGPIMDEKSVDTYTKSPSVRARYLKKNKKEGYYTPEASSSLLPSTPGTPAWLKKGMVRMKSLDYRFSDQGTAVFDKKKSTGKGGSREQQKLDSHAYRMKILSKTAGGLPTSGSGGALSGLGAPSAQLNKKQSQHEEEGHLKSPGYRREKQMDIQRKKEERRKEEKGGKDTGAGAAEIEKEKEVEGHKSSFLQCTFNMSNILMGVGMLGLPFVLRSAGYIGGLCTTVGFCLVTWRTSYYLGRELNGDPRPVHLFGNPNLIKSPTAADANGANGANDANYTPLTRLRKPIHSFPDIAREAFGNNGCICLSAILYFELFSCLSIFFVSLGDHLHALFPNVSQSRHMTIVAGVLTLPSALLRTPKLLSYLSAVGTFATVAVVSTVVLSALVMFLMGRAGGARDDVVDVGREYTMYSSSGLPLALGIVAFCFSGHAIVPSIYSSMQRPQDFERMIDLTYGVVLFCCILVAISGYYMFGNDVEDQITLSLENQSTDANALMTCLTWLMILTAISKFTLTMFPLALGFEEMLTNVLPSDLAMEMIDSLVKIVLIFLALAVAIFFPSFSFLCSLVGLICTLIVSVIFPAMAHIKLFGSHLSALEKMLDWALVIGGAVVAVVGTIATVKADI